MGMSPLHARVHALFDQLPGKYYQCAMDNLYLSAKLCRSAWRCKQQVQVFGVVRQSGRGVPKSITQKEVTKKAEIEEARGTLKAAELIGDPKCEGLIALSLYDSKPFYMMTMACEKVEWKLKSRKLWDKELVRMVSKPFYRLNIVDDYNNNMNNVDLADQLRGSYRFDHWMRKRKWWWSMFFWCF